MEPDVGSELDLVVAERVFGWTHGRIVEAIPAFSRDMSTAWLVAEALHALDPPYLVAIEDLYDWWRVRVYDCLRHTVLAERYVGWVAVPEAICRVALQALDKPGTIVLN